MSQIVYLGFVFILWLKTGNILQFLKTYFLNWMKFYIGPKKEIGDTVLSIIVLSTTTESLNIFHEILIEIYGFKNIKVKIQF